MKFLSKIIATLFVLFNSVTLIAEEPELQLSTQEELNEMFGAPPDKSVQNWIGLDILGPVNHPFPYIWISPQESDKKPPNYWIKLESNEYQELRKFVCEKKCSAEFDIYTSRNPLRVVEYSNENREVRCIVPEKKACRYLTNILKVSDISWSTQNLESFQHLVNEYDCPKAQKIIALKKKSARDM